MAEQRVVTLHLPMEIDKLGRLGMVLDEIWPGCTLRPLPSGDIEIIAQPATTNVATADARWLCGASGLGYRCTRSTGHGGDHLAHDDDGRLLATWWNPHG